jgi:hypothetical protein
LSTENTVYNVQCYVILENNSSPTPEENNASTSNETNNTTNNQTNTSENNETNNTSNFNQTNTTVNNETGTSNNVNKTNCSFFGILFGTCKANQTTSNGTVNNKTNQTSNNTNVDYEVVKIGNKTVAVKNGTILNESATSKTCAQIKGYICLSGEICQNTTIYAKDAKCCISQCVKEEQATNTKLIGWVIVGIIVIIILRFFMVKFKKMKKKSDPLLNHGKR